jgi:hypothetical protein
MTEAELCNTQRKRASNNPIMENNDSCEEIKISPCRMKLKTKKIRMLINSKTQKHKAETVRPELHI